MIAESMEKPEAPEADKRLPQQAEQDQKPLTGEVHHEVQTTLVCTTLTEAQELQELAESVVEEVLQRVKELHPAVHVLRRAPLAISGRILASARRAEPSETSPADLQQEIGQAAREIAATLWDRLGKRLLCSPSDASEPRLLARRRQQLVAGGATRAAEAGGSGARQAEGAGYDGASPLPSLDQIPTDAVVSVGATLQSFVASQFERHFQCKFSEVLKLPLETIAERQPQPPQMPVSTQVTKEGEGSSRESEHWLSEATRLPPVQPLQNLAAVSPESSTLARRSIQNAICKVQHLHAELKAYAERIVRDALDTLKKEEEGKLEKEMHAKASSFEDSSEESTEESGLVEQLLERCGPPLTTVASGVHCGRRVAKQRRPRDGKESSPGQGFLRPAEKKIPAKILDTPQPSMKLPPIMVPGMVMPSEAEAQSAEELSPHLLPSVLQGSQQDAQSTAEGVQKPLYYPSAPPSRPCAPVPETQAKARPGSTRDTFPSTGQQYSRQPVPPTAPKPPSQRGARQRRMRGKLVRATPE
ncbi:uncharacterized protein LOC135330069 [Dromaius novaehollandiae]|uniref:uncharacterized protein LOC135330069 n=1 Tax=Dromaius novaehollandiae TaxID=8790 RepID=UPI00311FAEF7